MIVNDENFSILNHKNIAVMRGNYNQFGIKCR